MVSSPTEPRPLGSGQMILPHTCETPVTARHTPRNLSCCKQSCNPLVCGVRLRKSRMKKLWPMAQVAALILATPLVGCASPNDDAKIAEELNVNSRYIIENVHVSSSALAVNISAPLRSDLNNVVGSKFDDSALKTLADRIRKE